jgi:hypothetical protein
VFLAGRGAERRSSLQIAHDALETSVGLQSDVLRVLIAHTAEMLAELGEENQGTAKAAWRLDAVNHRESAL